LKITIEIPEQNMASLSTACEILIKLAFVLEKAEKDMSPWDSQKYRQEEGHLFISSIGDIVWSIAR
jgi:hypothetical protein